MSSTDTVVFVSSAIFGACNVVPPARVFQTLLLLPAAFTSKRSKPCFKTLSKQVSCQLGDALCLPRSPCVNLHHHPPPQHPSRLQTSQPLATTSPASSANTQLSLAQPLEMSSCLVERANTFVFALFIPLHLLFTPRRPLSPSATTASLLPAFFLVTLTLQ